jgi:hypothetical protein
MDPQRNVGILDKIVQQMNIASKQGVTGSAKELQLQYDVQVDVVTQLEGRVQQHLNNSQSSAPQIVKLKRDFERVQARVRALKLDAERLEKQIKSSGSVGGASGSSGGYSQTQDAAQSYQQMQLQIQQDVSQVEFNHYAF